MKYTQNQINQKLWGACDTFRGTIGSDKYKDYILAMLFIKYLSDRHNLLVDNLKEQYGDDKEMIEFELSTDRFKLSDECRFEYIYKRRNEENIGEIINKALQKIEEENSDKLEGVFSDVDFNSEATLGTSKQRNGLLRQLLEDFNNDVLDFKCHIDAKDDVIGNAYIYLITQFASDAGRKGGEFFTPNEVSDLIAKLVAPEDRSSIYERIIQKLIQFNEPQICCA